MADTNTSEAGSNGVPEMANLDDVTVKDGWVMGYVSTGYAGCDREFEIVTVEDWLEMTQEEAEETAREALLDNIDWWY